MPTGAGAPLALRQRRLVDEHAPELRLAAGEQVQDEVVLNRDVLVEELAQQLLVDVVADVHHRELEVAGHRGWERVDHAARTLHVEQDRPRASASRTTCASASLIPQICAAFFAPNGRIGSCATSPASRSLNSIWRMR
jgi:hypothetical protein